MIIPDLPIDQYHAHDAETNSRLRIFRTEGPLVYKRMFLDRAMEKQRTKALDEGAGFDCLVFDGEVEFAARYICKPEAYPDAKTGQPKPWNMNANYCDAWVAAREAEGKTVLDSDAWTRFVLMRAALRANPLIAAIMAQSRSQLTFRMKAQKFDGMEIQARPDLFSEKPLDLPEFGLSTDGLPFFSDLKTTASFSDWWNPLDPQSEWNGRPVWDFGYHRQGGMVQWIGHKDVGPTDHLLLVAEKVEPFRCGVIRMAQELRELGLDQVMGDLTRLQACRTANVWPGSPAGVIPVRGPNRIYEQGAREAQVSA
jgi:hypothetical protein